MWWPGFRSQQINWAAAQLILPACVLMVSGEIGVPDSSSFSVISWFVAMGQISFVLVQLADGKI